MTSLRRLAVMRHAHAEPYAATDADRRLDPRGRQEAEDAGRWLAEHGVTVEYAAVSSAARTQDTWELVRRGSGIQVDATVEPALYNSDPETVLEVLRRTPDEVRTLLYLGHNPTASYLASVLDGGEGDVEALRGLLTGFTPSAVAVFELDGPWTELAEGTARLVLSRVPGR